jgi:hypothetical protein
MRWYVTKPTDSRGRVLADRHYSRQKPGTPEYAPPGRKLVLVDTDAYAPAITALWITSWPFAQFVNRDYKDAWLCCLFRNESAVLSSELIVEAIAATRWKYGTPPVSGMVTMIDAAKVTSRNPGYCYKIVGFVHVGYTKSGLHMLQLKPEDMPEAAMPGGTRAKQIEEARHYEQLSLFTRGVS